MQAIRIGAREIQIESQPEADPEDLFWNLLWPGAVALSTYLSDYAVIKPGTRVLELGCGTGLAGIVAGLVGADVVFNDISPDALRLTEANAALNGLARTEVLCFDWANPPQTTPFPIILGADIMYDEHVFPALLTTLDRLLTADGIALFSDPIRSAGTRFLLAARRAGFEFRQILLNVDVNGRDTRVGVYEIRRKSSC